MRKEVRERAPQGKPPKALQVATSAFWGRRFFKSYKGEVSPESRKEKNFANLNSVGDKSVVI